MERNVFLAWLLDFYGAMLTDRQRFLLSQRLDEDFTVQEIANLEGISRQGVYDAIRKAEAQLEEYEEKLGLLKRYFALKDAVDAAIENIETGNGAKALEILKSAGEDE
ncbi:MAG: hypothetical protein IJF16_11235 [Clostridia bacterium]|nr:hypothetical protein [Clostridia bacterium]